MHIISIANQKGGVGKSTLSSLFAYYLADKKSARVLAVDLDGAVTMTSNMDAASAAIAPGNTRGVSLGTTCRASTRSRCSNMSLEKTISTVPDFSGMASALA